ncbi:FtsX-like permease family protein [Arthrobacter sp. SDTb3-6]|uniref:FtsX-like permease family protein n=1 Tax=Arthrobacter sp. SDTb3-6 TaxID=2713571 RepID=UPI00159D1281|nr:ABC transporter permease [Arthrobacter sp. SDTb3-6]NVN00676.1 ABC transporter permease [Arthrobacter sp. SDTb3-6]
MRFKIGVIALAGRIAFRELRRDLKVSLLIVALIALPVAAGTTFTVVSHNAALTVQQRIDRALGGADARITQSGTRQSDPNTVLGAAQSGLVKALGSGTQLEALVQVPGVARINGQDVASTITLVDQRSSLTQPLYVLRDGKWPTADRDIAVSQAVANRLGATIGTHINVAGFPTELTITGIAVDVVDTESTFLTIPLDEANLTAAVSGSTSDEMVMVWLVRAGPDQLQNSGLPFLDRQGVLDRIANNNVTFIPMFLGVIALIGVITLSGFMAVSRKQRQSLGQLSVVGAGRTIRRNISLISAGALSICGTLLGVAVGSATSLVLLPVLKSRSHQDWLSGQVPLLDVMLLVVATMGVAWLSSALTARSVAKFTAREAMSSRDSGAIRTTRAGVLVPGVIAAAGATVMLMSSTSASFPMTVAGTFMLSIGAVLLLLSIIRRLSLGDLAGPIWFRLAVRDALRAPARTRAVALSTTSVVALGTVAAFLLPSLALSMGYTPDLPPGSAQFTTSQQLPPSIINDAQDELGAKDAVQYQPALRRTSQGMLSYLQVINPLYDCLHNTPVRPGVSVSTNVCAEKTGFYVMAPKVALVDAKDLPIFLGLQPSQEQLDAFNSGTALVTLPQVITPAGTIQIRSGTAAVSGAGATSIGGKGTDPTQDTFELAALAAGTSYQSNQAPTVLLPMKLMGRHNITTGNEWSLFLRADSTPTTSQQDKVLAMLLKSTGGDGRLYVERGDPSEQTARTVITVATALIGLTTVTVILLFVVLSNLQVRRDAAILSAVGANRKNRRIASSVQAALTVCISVTVALLTGILGARILAISENAHFSWGAGPALATTAAAACFTSLIIGWFSSPKTTKAPRTLE